MSVAYYIDLLTPGGVPLRTLAAFSSLTWARAENTIGALDVLLPFSKLAEWEMSPTFFQTDQQMEVFRNGKLLNETVYFLRYAELLEDVSGVGFVHLIGLDANYLLDGRIVAAAAGSANAEKTDYCDDMMKEIIDEQIVSASNTNRRISTLTIAPDLSDAPSKTKAFSRRNVLQVLQEIAATSTEDGTYLCFDVVRTARNAFEFRTYTGQRGRDHTQDSGDMRHIGQAYGNLSKPALVLFDSRKERNYAYAGGRGEGSDRTIQTAVDTTRTTASPYNRREIFIDARNTNTTNAVLAKAEAAIIENQPIRTLEGQLKDTDGLRFNVDYGFGDLVTVEAFGYTTDCHIDYIEGQYKKPASGKAKEIIKTRLRGEL